ncbi:hypothetical protein [Pyrodictium abyssi]|uniref:Uncharacterized protein n=1 Tax=Pyrodictium abyssi TaxID=54256 RepID=A0ABN6ZTB2_9CREN|nr:hypothetical protein PABY_14900 [Pyrodictium abyssi]
MHRVEAMDTGGRVLLFALPLVLAVAGLLLAYATTLAPGGGGGSAVGEASATSEPLEIEGGLGTVITSPGAMGEASLGRVRIRPLPGVGVAVIKAELEPVEELQKAFQSLQVVLSSVTARGEQEKAVLTLDRPAALITLDYSDFYATYAELTGKAYYEAREGVLFDNLPIMVHFEVKSVSGGPRLPAFIFEGYDGSTGVFRSRLVLDLALGTYRYEPAGSTPVEGRVLPVSNGTYLNSLFCGRGVVVLENTRPGENTTLCFKHEVHPQNGQPYNETMCFILEPVGGAGRDFLIAWEDSPEVITDCTKADMDGDEWIRVTLLDDMTVRIAVYRSKGGFKHVVRLGGTLLYEKPPYLPYQNFVESGNTIWYRVVDEVNGVKMPLLVSLG